MGAALFEIRVAAFVDGRRVELWQGARLIVHHGHASFLLQNFYNREHADNFMMHLLVEDVEAWWRHIQDKGFAAKYGVTTEPPADRPGGMRDFVIIDPTGVLWRIAQNTPARAES